jgi:malate dehydrogenase (oxaloacetate-decarboxylating)(NADP+)
MTIGTLSSHTPEARLQKGKKRGLRTPGFVLYSAKPVSLLLPTNLLHFLHFQKVLFNRKYSFVLSFLAFLTAWITEPDDSTMTRSDMSPLQTAHAALNRMSTPMDKYMWLHLLHERNPKLFFELLDAYIEEIMPIVYTPTVGDACLRYHILDGRPRNLVLSLNDIGHVREKLDAWPQQNIRTVVMTDGERILGLGDLGVNGAPIPFGKLALVIACGGVDPTTTLPVTIDVGTNNENLLSDPLYQGLRHRRVQTEEKYDALIEEFIAAANAKYPHVLIQFEDFASHNAFRMLEHYRSRICTFNDDIQGTAAVTLAGVLSAVHVKGTPIAKETFLFLGAGEAARGIADLVVEAIKREGVSDEEAVKRCYLFDSKGLVVGSRKAELQEHKLRFAHEGVEECSNWEECVERLRPTAIIGVSAKGKSFTERCVRFMAKINEQPIIFPLSNPTSCSECTAEEAFKWTDGRCLFASGSPFSKLSYEGRNVCPSQANNVYVFPGVAQGVVLSKAKFVTDAMFMAAADTIASMVTKEELSQARLFPSVQRIREVSEAVAVKVAEIAFTEGIAGIEKPASVAKLIADNMFHH